MYIDPKFQIAMMFDGWKKSGTNTEFWDLYNEKHEKIPLCFKLVQMGPQFHEAMTFGDWGNREKKW